MFTIFHGKKLQTRFSQNHIFSCSVVVFFETVGPILTKTLTIYSSRVWLWPKLELCQNLNLKNFFDAKNYKQNLIFLSVFFKQRPFCYIRIKIINSSPGHSHSYIESKSFSFLFFRWFFTEKTSTPLTSLFS